jgi:hypothetical protein
LEESHYSLWFSDLSRQRYAEEFVLIGKSVQDHRLGLRIVGFLRKLALMRRPAVRGRSLVGLLSLLTFISALDVRADNHRFATVPAIANVTIGDHESGSLHYIVIQLDAEPQHRGPTIHFSERARGSAVSDDWKEGARLAVTAAADVVGEDPRNWMLTIKNAANTVFNRGSSASSVLAVGVILAARGEALRPGVALTGVLLPDGRIGEVGGLLGKLEGAAAAKIHTFLIPRGQGRTAEWDLFELGRQRNVTVIEVRSVREAYELMTGKRP